MTESKERTDDTCTMVRNATKSSEYKKQKRFLQEIERLQVTKIGENVLVLVHISNYKLPVK